MNQEPFISRNQFSRVQKYRGIFKNQNNRSHFWMPHIQVIGLYLEPVIHLKGFGGWIPEFKFIGMFVIGVIVFPLIDVFNDLIEGVGKVEQFLIGHCRVQGPSDPARFL